MSARLRGADLLVRAMAVSGLERLFALSGNQIMPVFDACIDEGIELIHVRHEAAAVHMADAWGRLTGRPGAALVTAGPGLANALGALYVARCAESPLVLVSGQSPHSRQRQGAFQELPQAELAGHVAKASWTVTEAGRLGHELARAFRTALAGRPGPVHLAVPADVLDGTVDSLRGALPAADDFFPPVSLLAATTAQCVLDEIDRAERPLVLAGPALVHAGRRKLLNELSEAAGVPVVGMESPRGTDDPSLGRFADVLAEADLILLLGKELDFTLEYGQSPTIRRDCRFLQLDPEPRVLARSQNVADAASVRPFVVADLSARPGDKSPTTNAGSVGHERRLVLSEPADAVPAAERLIEMAAGRRQRHTAWRDHVRETIACRPPEWQTLKSPPEGPLHPLDVCRSVQQFLDEDAEAVFVSDGGEFGQWAQACLSAEHRVINGPSGAIGGSIPFALAARLVFPESQVVAAVGDGAFGFHAMEFDTAVRYGLPFVAVIGNDACWNAERQIQLREYAPERAIGTGLLQTRYEEIVRAIGGHGELVCRPANLQPALRRSLESQKPSCVNVLIESLPAPQCV